MNKTLKELNEEFLQLEEETQNTLYQKLQESDFMKGYQSDEEHPLAMAIAVKKDILKLGENYPGAALAIHAADMGLPRAMTAINKLEEQDNSFPLKKYSYAKKNEVLN